MVRIATVFAIWATALLLGGCASNNLGDPGGEYEIVRSQSPFYVVGPRPDRRADDYLEVGTRVTLVRKELGYSLVRLEDDRTGYVPNEDMVTAPPRPKPKDDEREAAATGSSRRSGGSSTPYRGPQVNDIPLPDLPPPDLNIAPEDIIPVDSPIVPPESSPTPVPTPRFRY